MRNLILLVLLLCATNLAAQTPITVQDPSFETSSNWPWNGGGSWVPSSGIYTSPLPDGTHIGYANANTVLQQDLGVTSLSNGTYALQLWIGHRTDGYATVATIQLLAGTTSLCSLDVDSSTITAGTFAKQTLSCPVGGTPPSGNLNISIYSHGTQTDVDNVTLAFTSSNPPPAHQAILTWQDNVNPTGTTYNVYRGSGSTCSSPSLLAANVPNMTYTDTTITTGVSYCYKVTAVVNQVESNGPFLCVTLGLQ